MYLTSISTYLRLRGNLRKSLDQLRVEQWQAFCDIVQYAYDNVPFYKRLYDHAGFLPNDLKTPDDVRSMPVTEKSMFQKADLNKLLAREFTPEQLVRKRTSGSSGFPLLVYFTPQDRIYRTLLHLRALFANGMGFRDHIVQISDKRHIPDFRYMFQKLGFLPKDFIYCADRADQLLNALTTMQPTVVYSYASSLVLIAHEIKRRGNCPITPKLIFTTGELMHPCDRQNIEEAFSVAPHDIYGIIEMGDLAWECSELNGYHLNIDSFLVEVLTDHHSAEPGEPGKLVVTNLHSRAMPFIRYEVGDIVTAPRDAPCSCGCNFPRIEILQGREDDWLYGADRRRISPMDITVARIKGVTQYRITQKKYDYLIVEIVPGQGFSKDTLQGVREHVSEAMGAGVHVEVTKVDEIPRQSGKLKSFFCEIKQPIHE